MRAPRPFQSVAERIEEAFATAAATDRTPLGLVLGKEDYRAFQEWTLEVHGLRIDAGDKYRNVPVRLNELVFLSCLELRSAPGMPNALRL